MARARGAGGNGQIVRGLSLEDPTCCNAPPVPLGASQVQVAQNPNFVGPAMGMLTTSLRFPEPGNRGDLVTGPRNERADTKLI